jgi:pimeloyl-ACP methyl ester carboxylesterase
MSSTLLDPHDGVPLEALSSDGVRIIGRQWGDPVKPAIVFIHGFNQAQLCWARQIRSPLRERFQLLTYDLRGHGESDKPRARHSYRNSRLWSDDLTAILDTAGIRRAVFVAWSLGGRVVFDYMSHYGQGRVAGLNLVGAGVPSRPEFKGTGATHLLPMMCSRDLSVNIAGTIEFARRCFALMPTDSEFLEIIAYNMAVPAEVRALMIGMPNQGEDFVRTVAVPSLVTFGLADALNSLEGAKFAASCLPRGQLSLYEGVGHSPFFEAPGRFNSELAAFAGAAWAQHASL